MKIPGARINRLLSQIFPPSLRALISEFSIQISLIGRPLFPLPEPQRVHFPVTSSRSNFSPSGGKFCSCITSTQRRSPGSTGVLVSGPQGHTDHTRAINSMELLTRKTKIFQKWNHSFHWSLYKKPHSLEVRSFVVSYSLRQRWRTILYTWN